ncbi:MAG TPA: aldo/keto reductase [Acidimicrobiales bacterium]|nr:aldo/keto reductase [Acidimicrobiales bacterium]
MDYRTFGRTGLRVSVAGIGAGGASRLGLSYGGSEEQAIAVMHRAIDLGINYFDTAESYQTEEVVGRALAGHRDEVVISSKIAPFHPDGVMLTRAELREAVEAALTKLQTEVVDVYHLHRPSLEHYDYCRNELVPELEAMRDEGKLRFLALSESTSLDNRHSMLHRAVEDDCWDVIMTGFNLFNQSARDEVFPGTIEKGVAVEIMGAARGPFSRPEVLGGEVARLVSAGELDPSKVDPEQPLSFLDAAPGVDSMADASYRFAAHEPGVNVVLIGTGKIEHLEENVAALSGGPLPDAVREVMVEGYGHLALGRG